MSVKKGVWYCAIILLLVLTSKALPVQAYTVKIGFDDSFDFTKINGFQCSIIKENVAGENLAGVTLSVDQQDAYWKVFITSSGVAGYCTNYHSPSYLRSGLLLSLEGGTPFTIQDPILGSWDNPDGNYDYPFPYKLISQALPEGVYYTYTTTTIVPLPSSLILLGLGLLILLLLRHASIENSIFMQRSGRECR
ncbi:MAG: hypothetical protein AB1847_10865 [bacterium]